MAVGDSITIGTGTIQNGSETNDAIGSPPDLAGSFVETPEWNAGRRGAANDESDTDAAMSDPPAEISVQLSANGGPGVAGCAWHHRFWTDQTGWVDLWTGTLSEADTVEHYGGPAVEMVPVMIEYGVPDDGLWNISRGAEI